MAEQEVGTCDICASEGVLYRKYYNYPFACSCHAPTHFELVRHCAGCEPVEPTVNLHGTMDARVWALEFMKVISTMEKAEIDEGLMIGWFANAIMATHDIVLRDTHKAETHVCKCKGDHG